MNYLVYTDGACSGNPGPGGYGVVIASETEVMEFGGREQSTTNNRMEIQAVVCALEFLKDKKGEAHIYSDSKYVLDGITQWRHGWVKRNWLTSHGSPVINQDLWLPLHEVLEAWPATLQLHWHHVAGHQGIPGNERADQLAVAFAKGESDRYRGPRQDYPFDLTPPKEDLSDKGQKKSKKQKKKPYAYISFVEGVFHKDTHWAQCEARVKGKDAKFRKVFDEDELEHWRRKWQGT